LQCTLEVVVSADRASASLTESPSERRMSAVYSVCHMQQQNNRAFWGLDWEVKSCDTDFSGSNTKRYNDWDWNELPSEIQDAAAICKNSPEQGHDPQMNVTGTGGI